VTAGLNPDEDTILEIACCVTSGDLRRVNEVRTEKLQVISRLFWLRCPLFRFRFSAIFCGCEEHILDSCRRGEVAATLLRSDECLTRR
jgi:hypothetical protein